MSDTAAEPAGAATPAEPASVSEAHAGHCRNCQAPLTGPYCAACGQSAHLHRSLGGLGHDILHGVFHFEGKVWHTLPELIWRPGQLTRRYIEGERSRYIILAEMKSGSISVLEEEILKFGAPFRFMPQAWILTSEVSFNTLRSELIQKLGKLDTLIVVDTTHDKAAWFNFGPEADTKMRRLWQREIMTAGTAG